MDNLERLIELWLNSPANVQTYISVEYPEMWEALNKVSKR